MLSLSYYDFEIYMMKDEKIKNMLLNFRGKDYSNNLDKT
jgi:hypothetical protein